MKDWADMSVTERDEIIRRYMAEGENTFTAGGVLADCPYRFQQATWWRRGYQNAVMGQHIANKNRHSG